MLVTVWHYFPEHVEATIIHMYLIQGPVLPQNALHGRGEARDFNQVIIDLSTNNATFKYKIVPPKILRTKLFDLQHILPTDRVVHVAIALVIDEDQTSASRGREQLLDANHVTELIDVLPVFYKEVVDATTKGEQQMLRHKFMSDRMNCLICRIYTSSHTQ